MFSLPYIRSTDYERPKEVRQVLSQGNYLRDRFITEVDINTIKDSLKYHIPGSSQKLINRVANSVSHKPSTAGVCIDDMTEVTSQKRAGY